MAFVGLLLVLVLVGGAILYLIGMIRDRKEPLWCFHSGTVCLGMVAVAIVIASVITFVHFGHPTTHPTTTTATVAEKTATPTSHESFFWVKFTWLTVKYIAVAVGFMCLLALYYSRKPIEGGDRRTWREHFWGTVWNNNTWWVVGVGMFLTNLMITLYNEFGPALWLPENFPNPEQRAWFQDILNHLWSKTPQPKTPIPTDLLPWATGTWFGWKATGLYLLFAIGDFPFAFWDKWCHAWTKTGEFIHQCLKDLKEMEERRRQHPPPTPSTAGGTQAAVTETSGFKIFSWSFLAEIVGGFVGHWMEHRH